MTFLGMEEVKPFQVVAIFLMAAPLMFISMAFNHYIFEYNIFLRSIFEESFRIILIIIVFRWIGSIFLPSIILSLNELIFGIFVNFAIFKPKYMTYINYDFIYAVNFSILMVIFGVFSGIVYRKTCKEGSSFFWGLLTVIPVKISIYTVNENVSAYFSSNLVQILVILAISCAISVVSFIIYRKSHDQKAHYL